MNPIDRLLHSLAWRGFKYANLNLKTASGLELPMRQRGEFALMQELFMHRSYDPFFSRLREVRSWLDLGCNAGLFSLALYDYLQKPAEARAVLVDAGNQTLVVAHETVRLNGLDHQFLVRQAYMGPDGRGAIANGHPTANHSGPHPAPTAAKTVSLQKLILSLPIQQFDLIRIDIKGAEAFLIPAETETLKRFRYALVEWRPEGLPGEKLFDWIAQNKLTILHQSQPKEAKRGLVLWESRG